MAMKLMNQLERKLYRYRINPFFRYIIFAMAGIYVLQLMFMPYNLIGRLDLNMHKVLQGEVWRLVTFLLLPPATEPLYAILSMYFYYFIGTVLESRWGARRFLIYYLFGALGAVIAALITSYGTNLYLNMSLFFAFALMYPEHQVLLFMIVPVKIKWLALANALFFLWSFINTDIAGRAAIVFSLLNLILFFGGDMLNMGRLSINQWRRRQAFRRNSRR
jgi:membrane associated rhomboid family serine protease